MSLENERNGSTPEKGPVGKAAAGRVQVCTTILSLSTTKEVCVSKPFNVWRSLCGISHDHQSP
jgi:hypothetical protein